MKTAWLFLALAAGTINCLAVHADDDEKFEHIREAVRSGRILPLQQILDRYQRRFGSRLLDLEVEHDGELIVYELEMLQADGRVIELKVDARDGRLLKKEVED